jgi:hypothetical protein
MGVQSAHLVAAPAAYISAKSELAEDAEVDSHPQYSFTYSVNDASTGDHKSQTETRDGDFVSGQVSFLIFFFFSASHVKQILQILFASLCDFLHLDMRTPIWDYKREPRFCKKSHVLMAQILVNLISISTSTAYSFTFFAVCE